MAAPLAPMQVPIGIYPNYYAQQQTNLVLKEKVFSFSGDDFGIKTDQGIEVIRCHGKVASLSGRKEFMDPQGNLLFALKKKHFSFFPKKWYLEDANGVPFVSIESRFAIGKTKINVFFTNKADGRELELNLRGDFFDTSAAITCNGVPVANIIRKFGNAAQIFAGQQTYIVSVAPGVDLALIAALGVALDEVANEGKSSFSII